MHTIADILSPERVFTHLEGSSKKRILQDAAQLLSDQDSELVADEVFDRLIAREKLGSTGFGNGVAIPHCRLMNCSEVVGAFIKLQQAINFDSIDKQPVDLLFLLLVPEEANDSHLNILSQLAEKFGDTAFRTRMRETTDKDNIFNLLAE